MPQIINTNISALNAQRNLNKSQMAGHRAMERLSSGLRINSAKDDAAGLAIASRMTSQITGLTQAARNANDGVSLTATADGTLGEISNSLQRIRELAVQSANATNSASDRASLQAESSQLTQEITRQANSSQFNGINLLDGSFTAKDFQVGANANQTITVASIADSRATNLGSNVMTSDGTKMGLALAAAANQAAAVNGVAAVAAGANFKLSNNAGTSLAISYAVNSSAASVASAINTGASSIGITASATNSATLSGLSSTGTVTFNLWGGDTAATSVVKPISAVVTSINDLSSVVAAINGAQGTTGITASFTNTSNKASITLTTADGRNIGIDTFSNTGASTIDFAGQNGAAGNTLTKGGNDSSVATGTVSIQSTAGQVDAANSAATFLSTTVSNFHSVNQLDISTAAGAQTAIATVDAALNQVNESRGDLGAVSNRFDSVINNLQSSSENASASRSRIQDADFAAESAELSRTQVLQQAGTAMLAQANQSGQGVMALLR